MAIVSTLIGHGNDLRLDHPEGRLFASTRRADGCGREVVHIDVETERKGASGSCRSAGNCVILL
jgi:hypothetical protein